MCLATVYKENDDSVIFKNVSRINVDGNKLVLRDIMGDERVVEGTILMVDLANSIVKVKCDRHEFSDYCSVEMFHKVHLQTKCTVTFSADTEEQKRIASVIRDAYQILRHYAFRIKIT